MQRTVYFDPSLSMSSLGLALRTFVPGPNGLPFGGVGEGRTDADSVGTDGDRLAIAQAATLLGIHKNTVHNRVKKVLAELRWSRPNAPQHS